MNASGMICISAPFWCIPSTVLLNDDLSVLSCVALAALAGSQLRSAAGGQSGAPQQSQEMAVPNELIGCIIGKGGTKIAEIR